MSEQLLTLQEVAERLSYSTQTIRRLMRDGLPYIRLGKRTQYRFNMEEVMRWIDTMNRTNLLRRPL